MRILTVRITNNEITHSSYATEENPKPTLDDVIRWIQNDETRLVVDLETCDKFEVLDVKFKGELVKCQQ